MVRPAVAGDQAARSICVGRWPWPRPRRSEPRFGRGASLISNRFFTESSGYARQDRVPFRAINAVGPPGAPRRGSPAVADLRRRLVTHMVVDTLRPETSPSSRRARADRGTRRTRLAGPTGGRRVPVNRWTIAGARAGAHARSVALRVGQLHFHYWIDEAISVGISSHPLSAAPLAPAPGRVAAAVLRAAARLDVALRARRGGHARPVAGCRSGHRAGRLLGGRGPVRPARRGLRRHSRRRAAVPHRRTPRRRGCTRCWCCCRCWWRWPSSTASSTGAAGTCRCWRCRSPAALYTHNWSLFMGLATFLAFLCVRLTCDRRRGGSCGATALWCSARWR